MDPELQLLFIKNGKICDIKALMQSSSKENEEILKMMRIQVRDLYKKGQIGLDRKQLFFPTEVLERSCEIQVENDEDTEENLMLEVLKSIAAATVPDEISKMSCEIKIEKEGDIYAKKMLKVLKSVAATTVPFGLVLKRSGLKEALAGIFNSREVKKDIIFGPYMGVSVYDRQEAYLNGYCWDIYKNNKFHHCIDARNSRESNWMRYVNPTDSAELQNLEAFQRGYRVYFRAIRDIPAGTQLLVWYSLQYNQDFHKSIPNLESKSAKSLEKIVSKIKKYNIKCDLNKYKNVASNELIPSVEKSFKCEICDKSFGRKGVLTRHKIIHTRETPHICEICDKAFPSKSSFAVHKRIHTGEKPFKCEICDKAFIQLSSLNSHKRFHTREKPFKCEICEKAFLLKSNLVRHKRIHTGEKPHRCDTCDIAFSQISSLTAHKRIHTGEKPFKCEICDNTFKRMFYLTSHKRIHTGEKPFKCDVCDTTFTFKSSLYNHKIIHTGEKPHKCHTCDKAFTHLSNLKSHQRIHTREKIFKCKVCDKGFACQSSLKQHKGTHSVFKKPQQNTLVYRIVNSSRFL